LLQRFLWRQKPQSLMGDAPGLAAFPRSSVPSQLAARHLD
jgi:hypothetical protein